MPVWGVGLILITATADAKTDFYLFSLLPPITLFWFFVLMHISSYYMLYVQSSLTCIHADIQSLHMYMSE